MATDKESLIDRLRVACNGLPGAVIAWPHRILHEAADELTAANARIAELEREAISDASTQGILETDLEEANRRIAELEALLGEAPHSISCQIMWPVPPGQARWPCNCFKSRA